MKRLAALLEDVRAEQDDHASILADMLDGTITPTPNPTHEPTPTPDPDTRLITLGGSEPIPTLAQIGNRHETAIAHWNAVPEQTISDGFTVGVIAHHLDGIDRVEISANGGPWTTATLGINPRTRCQEYWATLDLAGHNGAVMLRAVAYPNKGMPVVVEPLGTTYSKQDLTLYAGDFVGGVPLELPAGEHNLSPMSLPNQGWLIVRPAPGVAPEQCVLVGESQNWGKGRLKLENLTLRLPPGNNAMRGKWDLDADRHYHGNHVWFDRCQLIGNGPKDTTSWTAYMWESQTYTDCEISRVQNATHSHGGIKMLIRNNYIHDIYEDVFRSSGLHVNCVIEDVSREPLVEAQGLDNASSPHPDIWQYQNMPNTIAQDITAVKNINAQGLFPKDIKNTALVRCRVHTVSPYRAFAIEGEAKNVLIQDSSFDNGGFRGYVPAGERLVLENLTDEHGNAWLPSGSDAGGVEVRQNVPKEQV